jgi:hypothetical protein
MTDKSYQHCANEWADMATSGLQWLKNVRDGISTADDAIANMELMLEHCNDVTMQASSANYKSLAREKSDRATARENRKEAMKARPPSDAEPWVVADDTGLRVTFRDKLAAWNYRNEYTNLLVNPTVTHEPATPGATDRLFLTEKERDHIHAANVA